MMRALRFVGRVVRRLRHVGLTRTASALSFTTLLGLVPLITIAFGSVAHFPVFQQWVNTLEAFLLRNLVPPTAYSVVHENLTEFVENAGRLTGISIVFVVVTALLATATVEREINLIWGIQRRRPLARRLVVYALGLTAGPVLIGATISFLTPIMASAVTALPFRELLLSAGLRPLPLVVGTLGLAALYAIVPARHVPLRYAVAAGLAAAVALEFAKEAFAFYITSVPTYKVVYGALAALPVFLIWIYLCWTIVLAGAAVTATLSLAQEPGASTPRADAGPAEALLAQHRPEQHGSAQVRPRQQP